MNIDNLIGIELVSHKLELLGHRVVIVNRDFYHTVVVERVYPKTEGDTSLDEKKNVTERMKAETIDL
ncbi:hypothetical protein BLOT_005599 [Blomia tropicalis]|nr:hypothetical protein BLOT_005599 [Blomia tropicalis]